MLGAMLTSIALTSMAAWPLQPLISLVNSYLTWQGGFSKMKTVAALIYCSLLSGFVCIGRSPSEPLQRPDSHVSVEADAVALWEKAIEAKGGRNRLSAVRNLLVAFKDKTEVALYVFPDKAWDWSDNRPTPLGVWVGM